MILRGDKPTLLAEVRLALELAGHTCVLDPDGDLICDEHDLAAPTMVIGHLNNGPDVGLSVATYRMNLTPGGMSCRSIADVIASARSLMPSIQIPCEQDVLIVGVVLPIPESGITVRELNRGFRLVSYVVSLTVVELNKRSRTPIGGRPPAHPAGDHGGSTPRGPAPSPSDGR